MNTLNAAVKKSTPATGISLVAFLLISGAGVLCNIAPPFISLLWAFAALASLWGLMKDRMEFVWYAIAASPALEVLARIGEAPAIPYESGKYFLVFALFLLLVHRARNTPSPSMFFTGKLIGLLLLPSILAGFATFNLDQWIFNGLAILELAALLIFVSYERWDVERFCRTLHYALVPVILIAVYITVKTPSFNKVKYTLGANPQTSGGFASNQVSTILGLGILMAVLLVLLKRPLLRLKPLNYVLIAFLLFRGLLTFSRGGMLIATIAIVIVFLFKIVSSPKTFFRFTFVAALFAVAGYLIFSKVNTLTHGALFLRYEGETKGTWTGYRKKSLNTMTAGRENIILTDFKIFGDNILFGVGPGGAKTVRKEYDETYEDFSVAAHTEFSRLLSEHGIGGLIVVMTLIVFPVFWVRKQKLSLWKGVSAALFFYALGTSTHSAMRTNVTSVYYCMAAIPVFYETGKSARLARRRRAALPENA